MQRFKQDQILRLVQSGNQALIFSTCTHTHSVQLHLKIIKHSCLPVNQHKNKRYAKYFRCKVELIILQFSSSSGIRHITMIQRPGHDGARISTSCSYSLLASQALPGKQESQSVLFYISLIAKKHTTLHLWNNSTLAGGQFGKFPFKQHFPFNAYCYDHSATTLKMHQRGGKEQ